MVDQESQRTHLCFELGKRPWAVAIESVRELVEVAPLTPIPGAPPWVRGVFNLRGAVVPLIDLGVKFGVGTSEATSRTAWIVAELVFDQRQQVVAFEADELHEVLELVDGDLLPTPPTGLGIETDCVRGVVSRGDGFALVLDLERVLTSDRVLSRVARGHP